MPEKLISSTIQILIFSILVGCGQSKLGPLFSDVSTINPNYPANPTVPSQPTNQPPPPPGDFTDLPHTPPAVNVGSNKAVFLNIIDADYDITFDVVNKIASYVAVLRFQQSQEGYPIFDVVSAPTEIKINQEISASTLLSLQNSGGSTQVRYINKILAPGEHIMEIKGVISKDINFDSTGVKVFFYDTDLDDRGFWENYLPSNLEYDQFPMEFKVSITGSSANHWLYTSGDVTSPSANNYVINFDATNNSSCGYFHLTSTNFIQKTANYTSIDGRTIPVLTYAATESNATNALTVTLDTLEELENDYGPFYHKKYIAFLEPGFPGGMEHCGATITQLTALEHEITHSYFARGIIPANGNAGWIDEAIASWRDADYPSKMSLTGSVNMSNRGTYVRHTPTQAYSFGKDLMSHLHYLVSAHPRGLKAGLKEFFLQNAKKPYSTESFAEFMANFYGMPSIIDLFNQKTKATSTIRSLKSVEENPAEGEEKNLYHPPKGFKIDPKSL